MYSFDSSHSIDSYPDTLLFSGINGGGKGTQAKKLKDKGYEYLEVGAMLDEQKNRVVPFEGGKHTIEQIKLSGKLVPQQVIMSLIREFLQVRQGLKVLIDGAPRTLAQARALDEILAGEGRLDGTKMLYLKVDESTARKQINFRALLTGRPDDRRPEAVDKRIATFKSETVAAIEHYRAMNKLIEVSGAGTVDLAVAARMFTELSEMQNYFPEGDAGGLAEARADWEDMSVDIKHSITGVTARIFEALEAEGARVVDANMPTLAERHMGENVSMWGS